MKPHELVSEIRRESEIVAERGGDKINGQYQ